MEPARWESFLAHTNLIPLICTQTWYNTHQTSSSMDNRL